jgi:hypothetical protein
MRHTVIEIPVSTHDASFRRHVKRRQEMASTGSEMALPRMVSYLLAAAVKRIAGHAYYMDDAA